MKRKRPERATVKRWWNGDNGVHSRQCRKEENEKQHGHVEVVWSGGFEDSLLGNIAAHHCPALQVHWSMESEHIDCWETWSIKRSHPRKKKQKTHNLRTFSARTSARIYCLFPTSFCFAFMYTALFHTTLLTLFFFFFFVMVLSLLALRNTGGTRTEFSICSFCFKIPKSSFSANEIT